MPAGNKSAEITGCEIFLPAVFSMHSVKNGCTDPDYYQDENLFSPEVYNFIAR